MGLLPKIARPGGEAGGRAVAGRGAALQRPAGDRTSLPRGELSFRGGPKVRARNPRSSSSRRARSWVPGSRCASPGMTEFTWSGLLDLRVFELDRRRAAEDRDRDLEAGAVLVDLL